MNLTDLTLRETSEGLERKEFSSKEITRAYLERIEKYDPQIGAYLSVTAEKPLPPLMLQIPEAVPDSEKANLTAFPWH